MRLDPAMFRYLSDDDWRVLTALEMGMKNHELVPTPLVERIAKLRFGGAKKCLLQLLKYKLIVHENKQYDGYRLCYLGYDYLALHAFAKRGHVASVGNKVGVGKEADVYVVSDSEGRELILKLHRLGRTSFQRVTSKRDYTRRQGKRGGAGWLYLSRLAAQKEFAFMKALYAEKFPVPIPVDQNRHCVVMSIVPGFLLANITHIEHPLKVYQRSLNIITRLAQYGLIHGDLNEHNLLVTEDDEQVWVIDFPQMVSTEHANAQAYFDRDLAGVHAYFLRKYNLALEYHPKLKAEDEDEGVTKTRDLGAEVRASGWSGAHQKDMEALLEAQGGRPTSQEDDDDDGEDDDDVDVDVDVDVDQPPPEQATEAWMEEVQPNVKGKSPVPPTPSDDEVEEEEEDDDEDEEEDEEKGSGDRSPKAGQKKYLNSKGRGFFDKQRWELSQEATADEISIDSKAKPAGDTADAPQLVLNRMTDTHIRKAVLRQLTKERTEQAYGHALRANVQKGRQKVKVSTQIKSGAFW